MKVRLNDDPEIVKTIREGLKRTGGYCPCREQVYVQGVQGPDRRPELRGLLPLPFVLQGEIKNRAEGPVFYFLISSFTSPATVSTTPPISMKSARFHTSARFLAFRWGNCR